MADRHRCFGHESRRNDDRIAGNAAHLVDPYNIEEIRNGILLLINDDHYRDQLIQEGLKNVKRFSLKKIAQDYLKIYQNICQEHG